MGQNKAKTPKPQNPKTPKPRGIYLSNFIPVNVHQSVHNYVSDVAVEAEVVDAADLLIRLYFGHYYVGVLLVRPLFAE